MYAAEAGQWGDVLRLRKVMKKGSLKKAVGWSLVESENVVCEYALENTHLVE
jgi:hypothetical protein